MHATLATPTFGMSMLCPNPLASEPEFCTHSTRFAKVSPVHSIVWSWAEPLSCGISCSWGYNPLIASVCHLDINTWTGWKLLKLEAPAACNRGWLDMMLWPNRITYRMTSVQISAADMCEGGKPHAGFQTQCGGFLDNHDYISWLYISGLWTIYIEGYILYVYIYIAHTHIYIHKYDWPYDCTWLHMYMCVCIE